MKDLNYYLELPYTIVLRRDDEGDLVARIDELQGCTAHGSTAQEAFDRLGEEKRAWIEDAIEAGDEIPEPTTKEALPSGKWLQRVTRSLHAKIAEQAKREGVSLNQFVATVLAEAVGKRSVAAEIAQGSIPGLAMGEPVMVKVLDVHHNWANATQLGPYTFDEPSSPFGPFAESVRVFANRVPRRCTTGLKTLQDDAIRKNSRLTNA